MNLRISTLVAMTLGLLLVGCGSSGSSSPPTPKPAGGQVVRGQYSDRATGISITMGKVVVAKDHALLFVTMRNKGKHNYRLQQPVAFADSAIALPTDHGVIGSCSADDSQGGGLNFQSVSVGATQKGWIRCDFPVGSHVLIVAWEGHALASYHIAS